MSTPRGLMTAGTQGLCNRDGCLTVSGPPCTRPSHEACGPWHAGAVPKQKRHTPSGTPGQPPPDIGQEVMDALIAAHGGDVHAAIHELATHLMPHIEQLDAEASIAALSPPVALRVPPTTPSRYRIRIDLDGASPPIWRRVDLAGNLTLAQVHDVIQSVFSWNYMHLHEFTPDAPGYRARLAPSFANPGLEDSFVEQGPDEETVRLDQVVADAGDRLFYTYDFGDSWNHTLKVEKVLPRGDGPAAACLGGRRAAPPEDIGGIGQYNAIAAALAGKDVPVLDPADLEEVREWLGGDFDPADPDLDDLADLDAIVNLTPAATTPSADPLDLLDATQVGSGGVASDPRMLLDNPRFSDALSSLVERALHADAIPDIAKLVAAAELDLAGEPAEAPRAALVNSLTRQEAEAVTAPWRDLVAAVGSSGASGVAKDGGVSAFSDDTLFAGVDEPSLLEVDRHAGLTAAALALRLLRKQGAGLYVTKAGRDAAGDPVRMWRHLADRLTRGVRYEKSLITALALLLIAGPDPARTAFAALTDLMTDLALLGWRAQAITPEQAFAASATAWTVFEQSGCLAADGRATAAGRRLARAALLAS